MCQKMGQYENCKLEIQSEGRILIKISENVLIEDGKATPESERTLSEKKRYPKN